MTDTPAGLVAVGYVGLESVWKAIAWTSADGQTWRLASIDATPGSFAVAVAVGTSGTSAGPVIVAAGRSLDRPVAWTSADGRTWTRHELPKLGTQWERVTTIAATKEGFLAGGSVGPELGDRRARIWRSSDGATWTADEDSGAFDGVEVVAFAQVDRLAVAVARVGTGQRAVASVAFVPGGDRRWQRLDDPNLAGGLVNAVIPAREGGFLAVGSDPDERAAFVWRSEDGTTWARAPTADALTYFGGKARMLDVVDDDGMYVAVGNVNPLQYGTATSWRSADGVAWERSGLQPVLNQGEMLTVARTRVGLVAVGSFGAPDNYIPTIWLGPVEP